MGMGNIVLPVLLLIGVVLLFVIFIPAVTWISSRRKEREAFYKAETLRRITEASGEGAQAVLALLQEEEKLKQIRRREALKLGGVINIGVGLALAIFVQVTFFHTSAMRALGVVSGAYLGLFPGLIGVGLMVYVYFMAPPVE